MVELFLSVLFMKPAEWSHRSLKCLKQVDTVSIKASRQVCVSPQSVRVRLDDWSYTGTHTVSQSVSKQRHRQGDVNHFVKTPDGFLHKFGVFLCQI